MPGESEGKGGGSGDFTSIVILVTPFIAALGALAVTGTIGRVQRNEPEMTSWALVLILGAGTIWLLSSQFPSATRWIRLAACVPAVVGFALGLSAAVDTTNDEPRPHITASLSNDARKLTAEISASSMETEDRLAVFVDAFDPERPDLVESLYNAYQGPDSDGNVELDISTVVPEGPYTDVSIQAFTGGSSDCNEQLEEEEPEESAEGPAAGGAPGGSPRKLGSGTGCVVLAIVPMDRGDRD